MKLSLLKIIRRLQAMQLDQSGAKEQRRTFSAYGIPVCEVVYRPATHDFTFIRYSPQEEFQFDLLDLVAIEVYDTLYAFEHSF